MHSGPDREESLARGVSSYLPAPVSAGRPSCQESWHAERTRGCDRHRREEGSGYGWRRRRDRKTVDFVFLKWGGGGNILTGREGETESTTHSRDEIGTHARAEVREGRGWGRFILGTVRDPETETQSMSRLKI